MACSTGVGSRPRAVLIATAGVLWGLAAALPARAQTAALEEHWRGKAISLVIGYSSGGGYDTYARLVARHLGNHVPGRPQIVPRNMPGASSRTAAAWLFSVAAKDGLVLGTADQSLVLAQAMGESLPFDVGKLQFVGTPSIENNTLAVWHTHGIRSIEDARRREVTVGATGGSASSRIPLALNAVLGTRFKVVFGYPGGNEINLAMERGEVAGRGSNSWASWKGTRADWLKDKRIDILVQVGLRKAPDLDAPLAVDLAGSEDDRAVLRLLSAPAAVGRPIFTPPGVAPERVRALREAFAAMLKDAAFQADAARSGLDIDPVKGEELQKIVDDILATPKPVTRRLADILLADKP